MVQSVSSISFVIPAMSWSSHTPFAQAGVHSGEHSDIAQIRGRKVIIKPLTRSTLEDVQVWPKYTGLYACYNREEFETQEKRDKWYDRKVEADPAAYWLSIHDPDYRLIGLFNIHRLQNDPWHREVEIGIGIRPDECNKGYGTDAIMTLVNNIFSKTGLTRIGLGTRIWNKRAIRCYEKCGFVPCGKSTVKLGGRNVRFIEMELVKERFLDLQERGT